MEQFSLEKWLQDKSRKVVTRDGREVEILKTNRKDSVHPIIFTVLDQNNIEQVHLCNVNGICTTLPRPNKFDLFFADEEEKAEEFKETMISFAHAMFDHLLDTNKEVNVEEWEDKLLDLARKEIEKENPYSEKQDEQKPADKVEPKWKKGNDGEVLYETSVVWIHNETKTLATAGLLLDSNTFYLPISELEKLPKEEFEKQGEQKPADKPNIGIGDWIINNDKRLAVPTQILKIEEYGYVTSRGYTSFNKVKTDYRLWTIEDAKKGDILQANDCTLIFDSLAKDMDVNTLISSWYYCDTHAFYGIDASQPDLWVTEGIVPATEEQCDLLFQKMKEAGYKWNADKKELKKIEQVSTWNEKIKGLNELETYILSLVPDRSLDAIKVDAKNIRYIINKEQPAEWSRQSIIGALTKWLTEKIAPLHKKSLDGTINEREEMFKAALLEMRSFVNSPGFQIGKDTLVEWSEDDEEKFRDVIRLVEQGAPVQSIRDHYTSWLKSFKGRVQPQPK